MNAWLYVFFVIAIFFTCALPQVGLMAQVSLFGAVPNLVWAAWFLLVFFAAGRHQVRGFYLSLAAGFFLDLISLQPFGAAIVSLVAAYGANQLIVHLVKESRGRYRSFSVLLLAASTYFIYSLVRMLIGWVGQRGIEANIGMAAIGLVYTITVTMMAWFVCELVLHGRRDRQLTLF